MQSKNDYLDLIATIDSVAKSNNLKLPKEFLK